MKAIKIIICFCAVLFISSGYCFAQEVVTWGDCVKEAAKNHPDLIAAVERVNQSKASEKITASSLYPQVTGTLDASTSKTAGSNGSSTSDSYSYGASGSQLIFDGLKTSTNVKAAIENIKAAKENYRFVSSEVRFRLRSAFITLLRAQELIHVTEDIAKIRKDNFVLISLRYQSGLEHKGALLTAEANLAEAKFEVEQAKRSLAVAQRQLGKELGRDNFTVLQVQGEFLTGNSSQDRPDFEALVKDNPSLKKLIAQKNAAAFGVIAAKESFFPVLSAQAGAGRSNSRWPPQGDQWNLGLGVSLPIFDGGLRLAEVSQAKALLNQTKADERSTRDSLVLTLEQTWAGWQDALETVDVQKKTLLATDERSKIGESQYSMGLLTYDNWTIIEDDLVNAQKSLLNAQANALLAEANWVLAKGEALEYEK